MSNSSVDMSSGVDPELAISATLASDAESEGQIRARLGKYGLGTLFDAGGM